MGFLSFLLHLRSHENRAPKINYCACILRAGEREREREREVKVIKDGGERFGRTRFLVCMEVAWT
jgi:hypothetical protein